MPPSGPFALSRSLLNQIVLLFAGAKVGDDHFLLAAVALVVMKHRIPGCVLVGHKQHVPARVAHHRDGRANLLDSEYRGRLQLRGEIRLFDRLPVPKAGKCRPPNSSQPAHGQ